MYIPRVNQDTIFKSFSTSFVTTVLGSRRVGKSTLIKYYASQFPERDWVFLTMDKMEELATIERGELKILIEKILQRPLLAQKTAWVVIDEAQKSPAVFDQVKVLYDQYKDQAAIKFILTGSGFLNLHRLSAESLAGRQELFYLREFNLQEAMLAQRLNYFPSSSFFDLACVQHRVDLLQQHFENFAPLKTVAGSCIEQQLIWGGLPEVLLAENAIEQRNYLSNYLQTYLEKDIRALTTISDLNTYQQLLEIIAEQTGSVRQDKTITQSLSCARETLKKYRGILLATLVYEEIYPFIGSSLKRLVKSPKGYLLNNGLISYLTGIEDLSMLKKTGIIGHRFENWFLKELKIWLDRHSERSKIYYWRTAAGVEVDFIVEMKPHIFPFEVTYTEHPQEKKVKNLMNFMANEPKAEWGFYIYQGSFLIDHQKKICFIPMWGIN
jgi:hypothetical protein